MCFLLIGDGLESLLVMVSVVGCGLSVMGYRFLERCRFECVFC
jgi:hypothetical protein